MVHCVDPHVLDIASYCYTTLGLNKEVSIEVMPLEVHGYCYSDGDVEISDKLRGRDLGIAICHELAHCAQIEQQGHFNEADAYLLEEELYKKYIASLS